MSRSEINAIFAAPPKKKIKIEHPQPQKIPAERRSHPETILDPSKKSTSPQRRRREKKRTEADNARFKDSRGSVPRRKTVDGYNIYKEDELGVSTTGGARFVRSIVNAVSERCPMERKRIRPHLVSTINLVQLPWSIFTWE